MVGSRDPRPQVPSLLPVIAAPVARKEIPRRAAQFDPCRLLGADNKRVRRRAAPEKNSPASSHCLWVASFEPAEHRPERCCPDADLERRERLLVRPSRTRNWRLPRLGSTNAGGVGEADPGVVQAAHSLESGRYSACFGTMESRIRGPRVWNQEQCSASTAEESAAEQCPRDRIQ